MPEVELLFAGSYACSNRPNSSNKLHTCRLVELHHRHGTNNVESHKHQAHALIILNY